MKKLTTVLFAICLLFSMASAASLNVSAAEENTVIVFDAAKQNDRTIKIDVNVRENTGVYSMLFTLDYDTSVMTLTNVELGDAFQSLDPISSGTYDTVPYRISYLGTNEQNDTSTGRMMTLTFTVADTVPDCESTVTLKYEKNKDVTYLKDGAVQTKNIIVVGTKITLKNNEIKNVAPVEDGEGGFLPSDAPKADFPVVGIVVGAVFGAATVSVTAFLIFRRCGHKRRNA